MSTEKISLEDQDIDVDDFDPTLSNDGSRKEALMRLMNKDESSGLGATLKNIATTTVGENYNIGREIKNSIVGIQPIVQNVVSTVNLGSKLDLKIIALHARNAEYNPKRFAAVIMRIRDPKTTALIFSSGKIVCTGARSEDDSRLGARKFARIIQKLGFEVTFSDFKIQNIVGSVDCGFPIRLEGLQMAHKNFSTFEPELFPGLVYRMIQPKVVLLIFVSGKIVLTGAKSRDDIKKAFENIFPIVKNYDKNASQQVVME